MARYHSHANRHNNLEQWTISSSTGVCYGSCLWLKQRSLHQFLALMQIESVSHVHLLGAKGNVILISSFNHPQILLISQNHFLPTVQYSVSSISSLKPHSFFRHHISHKTTCYWYAHFFQFDREWKLNISN